jgi:hypothetical protein
MAVSDDKKKIAAAKKRKSDAMSAKSTADKKAKASMQRNVDAAKKRKVVKQAVKKIDASKGQTLAPKGSQVRKAQFAESKKKRSEGTATSANRPQRLKKLESDLNSTFRTGLKGKINY